MPCLYKTKITNVVNNCGKNVKARMSEAIVEHNAHVHILGPNVHV